MWTSKRFTSTLFLDSSIINEGKFYLQSNYISKIYFYYINNGYKNILYGQLSNIFINVFTVFFVLFLCNCINYSKLISIKDDTSLGEIIFMQNFFNLSIFFMILLVFFIVFIICNVLSILDDYISFKDTKELFNTKLSINDNELNGYKWQDILMKLKKYYEDEELDAYILNNKIMTKDNYMIGLLDTEIINISHLTKLMEWNIIYCIIIYIFDDKLNIKKNITHEKQLHVENINTRLKIVSFFNFLLMPFLFIFLIFYNLFEYCEKFYNSPKLISSRSFTLYSKWKFRYYNELDHHFEERMKKAHDCANEYMAQFHSKIFETLAKLVVFLLSSFFTILIIFSIINENVLLHLYIVENKSALWFIGILATIITLSKGFIKDKFLFFPKEKMKELRKHLSILPEEYEHNDILKVKDEIKKHYQFKIIILLKDLFYTLIVPFELFKLTYQVDDIVVFLQENTIRHNRLNRAFKLSLFDNILGLNNKVGNKKTIHSFHNFKDIYDEWYNGLGSINTSINII